MHGFTEQILTQYRTQRRAAIAIARIGRATRTLQLYFPAQAGEIAHFTQQDGASVAKLRYEMTELMSRIRGGDRVRTRQQHIAGEDRRQRVGIGSIEVQTQLRGERSIELDQARLCHRRRLQPSVELLRQAGIAAGMHYRACLRHTSSTSSTPSVAIIPDDNCNAF